MFQGLIWRPQDKDQLVWNIVFEAAGQALTKAKNDIALKKLATADQATLKKLLGLSSDANLHEKVTNLLETQQAVDLLVQYATNVD